MFFLDRSVLVSLPVYVLQSVGYVWAVCVNLVSGQYRREAHSQD